MLDNIVLKYYFTALCRHELASLSQNSRRAADVGMIVLDAVRSDLIASRGRLEELTERSDRLGFPVGPLRVMEVLLWCQVEPRGYYRAT